MNDADRSGGAGRARAAAGSGARVGLTGLVGLTGRVGFAGLIGFAGLVGLAVLGSVATLAGILALPGCQVSAWIFGKEVITPELHTVSIPCDVKKVEGRIEWGSDRILAVHFSPRVGPALPSRWDSLPAHLHRYQAANPGVLVLRPRLGHDGESPWPDDEGAFQPDWWELLVFNGEHLPGRVLRVRVVLHGDVEPQALGASIPAAAVPPALFDDPHRDRVGGALPGGLVDRCLRGFRAHRWLDLIEAGAKTASQVPLAWLGPRGRLLSSDEMRSVLLGTFDARQGPAPRECSLLGGVELADGTFRYVVIPVPVLIHAGSMDLARRGDVVRCALSQRWRGDLVSLARAPAGLPELDLPLANDVFLYNWSTEVGTFNLFLTITEAVARPLGAVIDFIAMANPTLANLLRTLFGLPVPKVPQRSRPK